MRLSKNFKLKEFDCRDGTRVPEGFTEDYRDLARTLEIVRAVFNKPITITSGYRSPEHNKKVGGAPRSQHLQCAADIKVKGISTRRVYDLIDRLMRAGVIPAGGLGLYNKWVHVDQRGRNVRWGK